MARAAASDRPLLIGLGHPDRGDDAVGILVGEAAGAALGAAVELWVGPGDGPELLDRWRDRALVVAVDAMRTGRPPGTIVRIEVGDRPLRDPPRFTSTHALSLTETIALGQALGRRPVRLVLFGIEAGRIGPGDPLSPEVAAAIPLASARVREELAPAAGGRGPHA